jgi:hypothetical protein
MWSNTLPQLLSEGCCVKINRIAKFRQQNSCMPSSQIMYHAIRFVFFYLYSIDSGKLNPYLVL